MTVAFVAAGANLPSPQGPPEMAVSLALRAIEGPDAHVIARSRLYASVAWPDPGDPLFVNAVARIETGMAPAALLARLHEIEAGFGRQRREPNAPRTLDLDIVDYGGRISAPGETPLLPHPRMADRAFVLLPLAEIAPRWRHPVSGREIGELIAKLAEQAVAWPLDP